MPAVRQPDRTNVSSQDQASVLHVTIVGNVVDGRLAHENDARVTLITRLTIVVLIAILAVMLLAMAYLLSIGSPD